jgi:predicted methyltransferase
MHHRNRPRLSLLTLSVLGLLLTLHAQAQEHGHPHASPHGAAHEHHFNDIEKAVKTFEDPARDAWQKPEDVVAQLHLKPGDVVVDIGAGTGYFTRRFAVEVGPAGQATGLDIEPAMVAYMIEDARKRALSQYTARQVSPNDPQLQPHSVDVVFICDTYYHMVDRVAYAKLLAQALKPGGRVVIVDFQKRPLPFGPPMEWRLTPEAVAEELRQAGFQLSRSPDFLPHQYFVEFTLAALQ